MTIPYHVQVAGPLSVRKRKALEGVLAETFREVDTCYNLWNPNSELSRLNRLEAGVRAPLSAELEALFVTVEGLYILTEGRFDPTVAPLVALWRRKLHACTVPSQEELDRLTVTVGWERVHWGEGSFWKEHGGTQIDLGGIAKGLCVDLLAERLRGLGHDAFYIDWGGELRTSGGHPEGRPWRIALDHPEAEEVTILEMREGALATSGDALQRWEVGGVLYSHIVDPKTGRPLEVRSGSMASVSVLASSSEVADALATALMIFEGEAEARTWLEQVRERYPELAVWISVH